MTGNPDHIDMFKASCHPVSFYGGFSFYTEFVFFQPGGYVRMGFRIDIRVYPNGNGCALIEPSGPLIDQLQFKQRLDIKHQDAFFKGIVDFISAFPHAGINNVTRTKTGLEPPVQLPAGHDIQPTSQIGEQL